MSPNYAGKSIARILREESLPANAFDYIYILRYCSAFVKDKSLVAWGFGRLVSIARMAYSCGYIDEERVWKDLEKAGTEILEACDSWHDFAVQYTVGKMYFHSSVALAVREVLGYAQVLFKDRVAWAFIPWGGSW